MANRDDTEVLKAIIAKSTNKAAVAVAQTELSSLQERKAAVSAAIKPVLDIPQIVAQPTSGAATEAVAAQGRKRNTSAKDDDVVSNIRKMREDINRIFKESSESKKLLDNILKTNQKYYESNNELINRLLISNGLLSDKMEEAASLAKRAGLTNQGSASGGEGAVTPQTNSGGGGILGALGWLAGGAGLWKAFKKKPPKVKVPKVGSPDAPKVHAPDFPELKGRRKLLQLFKKGGRAAAIIAGFVAAGLTAEWILSFMGADPDTQARMINDALGYVPDWLEDWVKADPELAILLGINAPMLTMDTVRAAKEVVPPVAKTAFKGGRSALKASTQAIKSTATAAAGVKNAYKTYAASRNTVKAIPGGASVAQEIWNKSVKGSSKVKTVVTEAMIAKDTGEMLAKEGTKIGLKKIPLVGLGLAGFMSALRGFTGDTKGALMELASGGLAMFPGAGTAGAVGVDAYLLARDLFEHYYGHYPDESNEQDRNLFMNDLLPKVTNYLNEQMSDLATQGVNMLPIDQVKSLIGSAVESKPVQDTLSAVPFSDGSADSLGAAIANETNAQVSVDSSKKVVGKAQYLEQQKNIAPKVAAPVPVEKMTQERLNNIGNPTSAPPNNVVVNQGDTVTNVTNNNVAGGGGSAGVAGSPTKNLTPFDSMLYGESYNWGY